jgi:hypothetical protein
MKKVFTSTDHFMIGHIRNLLEIQGIACTIKNLHISNLPAFIPSCEIIPEVWVLNDSDYPVAEKIVSQAFDYSQIPQGEKWECPNCKEIIDPQFSACWNCDQEKP